MMTSGQYEDNEAVCMTACLNGFKSGSVHGSLVEMQPETFMDNVAVRRTFRPLREGNLS
jgi:hypothetical protein